MYAIPVIVRDKICERWAVRALAVRRPSQSREIAPARPRYLRVYNSMSSVIHFAHHTADARCVHAFQRPAALSDYEFVTFTPP